MNEPPSDNHRAERLLDLVAEALERGPAGRAAFLAEACGGDEPLRAEVQSLLAHEDGAEGFLATPVFAPPGGRLFGSEPGELQPGDTLGDCRILRFLGEGGTGEVYLAQDTRLERPVAVKLLKSHFDEGLGLRRFHHERRVLAGLTHPNIARLYGGATTPEGRSYLVMEYIEGERLDRYCDTKGLDVTRRLELFRKVCAAVAYAHQNLVVHRDLKPANVRVTAEGEPKLLDFGIAKLLETEAATPGPDPTVTMQAMMTPEYASPEQLRGEGITTASDVYSLGVVLYELLTGQRPYTISSRRPDELARAICEQEPPRPSTVAGRGQRTETAATTGRETPARLRHRLEGDLDNIVAMALRKEPARRYSGVGQFSEDLRRHVEGLPVSARKDTLGYRAGKFVRRNKTGATAAALVALALVGGLAVATWQARTAQRERDVAQQERDHARLAQAQSEHLNRFLQTLLGSADPANGPGRELKVVQVLDKAGRTLDRELAGEPALLAEAHMTLGQAYSRLLEAEPAILHFRAAAEIDRKVYGDDNIVTARAEAGIGMSLAEMERRYAEAEPLLRSALTAWRRQPDADQQDFPMVLSSEVNCLVHLDRYDEEKKMMAELLSTVQRMGGAQSDAYINALFQEANLCLGQQDYAGAEGPYRQAVEISRMRNSKSPAFAEQLTTLAYILILAGKLDEPEGLLREARQILDRTVGGDNVAYNMNRGCLAWLHFLHGDYPAAEAELREAQAYARTTQVPKGEQDYVGGTVLLGRAIVRQGRATEGEPLLRESLDLATANHLSGNAFPENVAEALGECLLAEKRYAEAEPLLLRGYRDPQTWPAEHEPVSAQAARQLKELYTAWGKPTEAEHFAGGGASKNGTHR